MKSPACIILPVLGVLALGTGGWARWCLSDPGEFVRLTRSDELAGLKDFAFPKKQPVVDARADRCDPPATPKVDEREHAPKIVSPRRTVPVVETSPTTTPIVRVDSRPETEPSRNEEKRGEEKREESLPVDNLRAKEVRRESETPREKESPVLPRPRRWE